MPITIKTAAHEAYRINGLERITEADPAQIISRVDFDDESTTQKVLQAVTDAYNNHHHLEFRPGDVWIAIIAQFSSYINAHDEELRTSFVKHDGQKNLTVVAGGNRHTVDFGQIAQAMTEMIEENVVDPKLCDWILPKFTTTTDNDVTAAAILMMGTFQKYFAYGAHLSCGIPSVTLHGEKEDYEEILVRLDKLSEYGQEPATFCYLMKTVIKGFIRTFEDPSARNVSHFWNNVCAPGGTSSIEYYDGWIAVFCYWNDKGQAQVDPARPRIDPDKIPSGFAEVPIKVNDNCDEFEAEMLAGCVGMTCTSSGRTMAKHPFRTSKNDYSTVGLDTLRPRQGWFIYEK